MKRPVGGVIGALLRHRGLVLAVYGGLFGVACVGIRDLQVDYGVEQFFLQWGPEREIFDRFKTYFPREDLQVSAFLPVEGRLTLDDYEMLRGLAGIFRERGLESVQWVGSVDFVEQTTEDGEPAVELVRLSDDGRLTEQRLRGLVEARRDHALFAGALWNSGQTVFAVHGFLRPEDNHDSHRRRLADELAVQVDAIGADRGVVLTGLPILRATIPMALENDLGRLLSGGILVSFAVLLLFFRRLGLALLTLAGVIPALVLTLGVMGLVGRPVTLLTSFMPIVALVVGVSDAIHLVISTRTRWLQGSAVNEAVIEGFGALARSCFFTSLTTALGFLGLVATRIDVFTDFGIVTAGAVMAAYLAAMTLLPVLVSLARDLGSERTPAEQVCDSIVARIERLTVAKGPMVAAVFVTLGGAGAWAGKGLVVDARLVDDLKAEDPIMRELAWLEDEGFGVFQINVLLTEDGLPAYSPELLEWTEDFQAFVESDPLVLGSTALPQYMRQLQAVTGGEGLPATRGEAREVLFLAELEGHAAIEDVYLREDGVAQVIVYIRDRGTLVLSPFLERMEARLGAVPPPGAEVGITGTVEISQAFNAHLLRRFGPGILLSVLLVWGALVWMFRSVRLGVVALIPNLFPLAMLLGLMRVAGFDLKPSTVLVFAIAFGIVADDTIHFLGAVARRLSERTRLDAAVTAAIREVGPALVVTTAVVVAGFSVLTLSRFQALFIIGFLTGASALFAVGADLLGFPALLRWVSCRRHMGTKEDVMLRRSSIRTVLCLAAVALPVAAGAQETDAAIEIVREMEAGLRGYGDFEASLRMEVRDGDRVRERQLTVRGLEAAQGDRTLITLRRPVDLAGIKLLSALGKKGRRSQWMYLPRARRTRRIAGSQELDRFLGSHFTFADMSPPTIEGFSYALIRREEVAGRPGAVIERLALEGDTPYPRQVLWIDTDEHVLHRVDYFDSDGQRRRTLKLTQHAPVGGAWRPFRVEMIELESGDGTVLTWSDYRVGTGLNARDFDPVAFGRR